MKLNNETYKILQDLVEIPSVTDDTFASDAAVSYCSNYLSQAGLKSELFTSGGYSCLFASTQNTKQPKLLLLAHLDVVPGPQKLFKLTRNGSKLMGRGVFDMKFAAACYLSAVQQLSAELKGLDFGIMLTTDEEVGGQHGTGYLTGRGYGGGACLLPDGGDNWQVESSAKGAWFLEATAKGKAGHGSRPWEGSNSADKLIAFLSEAKQLFPQQRKNSSTMTISQLSAGQAINQIPASAKATLDIRPTNTSEQAELSQKLSQLAQKHEVTLVEKLNITPTCLDKSLPVVKQWNDAVKATRKIDHVSYAMSYGSSDARYLYAVGTPVIVTRPSGGGAHADDEWIDEAGLQQFYECVLKYIEAFPANPAKAKKQPQVANSANLS